MVCGMPRRYGCAVSSRSGAGFAMPANPPTGYCLAEREEPLKQAALVHHLDAARVQAERADDRSRLRVLFQHEHVHAVQSQLGRQHQADRPAPGHDHVNHEGPRSAKSHFLDFRMYRFRLDNIHGRPGACRKPPRAL